MVAMTLLKCKLCGGEVAESCEARRFGVRSAVPSVSVGRLCQRGISVLPRMVSLPSDCSPVLLLLSVGKCLHVE